MKCDLKPIPGRPGYFDCPNCDQEPFYSPPPTRPANRLWRKCQSKVGGPTPIKFVIEEPDNVRPKLTIGMATYEDYNGCYFTIQALRMHHNLSEVELIVVDNKPTSADSEGLRQLLEQQCNGKGNLRARYIPMHENTGTAAPRNRVFQEASGEAVLCIDSHILVDPYSIFNLIKWYADHPDSMDLLSGPLFLDNLDIGGTHFNDVWRGEMWGIWGQAWRCNCNMDFKFTVLDRNGWAQINTLEMSPAPLRTCPKCGNEFPTIEFPAHEAALVARGYSKLGLDIHDEFDIPGQGLGLFSCRKDAWLGFHTNFRGFGGEEMYIHEKFRKAGRRVLCVGFLGWVHRFARPGGVKYPLTRLDKVRNYMIGLQELGLPLDRLYEHFVSSGLFAQNSWDQLLTDPARAAIMPGVTPQKTVTARNIDDIYEAVSKMPRDLDKHFPKLRELANQCDRITEFSKRRESFIVFAAAKPQRLISNNIEKDDGMIRTAAELIKREGRTKVELADYKSSEVDRIPNTDMLFIDSKHTQEAVADELRKFAPSVGYFIALHDTELHGLRGEENQPGLLFGIRDFVKDNPGWFVMYHTKIQFGLTVLSRREKDKPIIPIIPWPLGYGPGTELKKLLQDIGINPSPTCTCEAMALQMDSWGWAECNNRKSEIVEAMKVNWERWGWKSKISAITSFAVGSVLGKFVPNPLRPIESLVEEAILRATKAEKEKFAESKQ